MSALLPDEWDWRDWLVVALAAAAFVALMFAGDDTCSLRITSSPTTTTTVAR